MLSIDSRFKFIKYLLFKISLINIWQHNSFKKNRDDNERSDNVVTVEKYFKNWFFG